MTADGIVFVDADDTLWENYRWFQRVLDAWTAMLASRGVDAAAALATLHAVEDENIPRTGYGAAPFVRSVVEAFHRLPRAGRPASDEIARFAKHAETTIRDHPIELLPGVREALPVLAARVRVVVLTKGQEDEQLAKVDRSGLTRWLFATRVVPEKHASTYAQAAAAFGVEPARCWMVGNSPVSDVNPALAAGFSAIHVPHPSPWHRDVGPLAAGARVAHSFAEVPDMVFAAS